MVVSWTYFLHEFISDSAFSQYPTTLLSYALMSYQMPYITESLPILTGTNYIHLWSLGWNNPNGTSVQKVACCWKEERVPRSARRIPCWCLFISVGSDWHWNWKGHGSLLQHLWSGKGWWSIYCGGWLEGVKSQSPEPDDPFPICMYIFQSVWLHLLEEQRSLQFWKKFPSADILQVCTWNYFCFSEP